MKVSELIEFLQTLPHQDAEVFTISQHLVAIFSGAYRYEPGEGYFLEVE